jgi:hypothetical protein
MFFSSLLRQTHFHCKLEGKEKSLYFFFDKQEKSLYNTREKKRKKNYVNTQYHKRKKVQK